MSGRLTAMAMAVPPNVKYYFEATRGMEFINLVTTRVVRRRLQPTREMAMLSSYRNKASDPFNLSYHFQMILIKMKTMRLCI